LTPIRSPRRTEAVRPRGRARCASPTAAAISPAARRLFAAHGFAAVSTDQIAEEAADQERARAEMSEVLNQLIQAIAA
jgi:Bacterial regulatory proteins, tetR family